MTTITIEQALADLALIFEAKAWEDKEDGKNFVCENSIFLDKRQTSRDEAIAKLSEYFGDKRLEDGYQCRYEPCLLTWAIVHLEERPKSNELER